MLTLDVSYSEILAVMSHLARRVDVNTQMIISRLLEIISVSEKKNRLTQKLLLQMQRVLRTPSRIKFTNSEFVYQSDQKYLLRNVPQILRVSVYCLLNWFEAVAK